MALSRTMETSTNSEIQFPTFTDIPDILEDRIIKVIFMFSILWDIFIKFTLCYSIRPEKYNTKYCKYRFQQSCSVY